MSDQNGSSNGLNRREFLQRGTAGTVLGSMAAVKAINTISQSAAAERTGYYFNASDLSDRTVRSSGDIWDRRAKLSSGMNYYSFSALDNSDEVNLAFRNAAQAVSREQYKNNGYYDKDLISKAYIDMNYVDGVGGILSQVDGSADHAGSSPTANGSGPDVPYDDVLEAVLSAALSEVDDAWSKALTALDIINALVNDIGSSGSGISDSETKFKWDWYSDQRDVAFFKKFQLEGKENYPSEMKVTNALNFMGVYTSVTWTLRYDGFAIQKPTQAALFSPPDGQERPVGPAPPGGSPEEARARGYRHMGPKEVTVRKIPKENLPETAAARQKARNHVYEASVPVWVKTEVDFWDEDGNEITAGSA